MAKLFFQEIPTLSEIQATASVAPDANADLLHANLVFMKTATELENIQENLLARFNLSSGRFILLSMLKRNPQGLAPSELANKSGVTQATISGLLSHMENAQLIQRHSNEADGRSYCIKLTEHGEKTLTEVYQQLFPLIMKFWSNMAGQDIEKMLQLFQIVAPSSLSTPAVAEALPV